MGWAAVRTATVVLGEFRSAAADIVDLCEVASQIDRRLPPYLEPEDFVTAVVAELRHDGHLEICSCGHPPPVLLAGESVIETLHARPGLPLGFGSLDPAAVTATDGGRVSMTAQLAPGTRLLLYTDGIIEARRPDGNFVDLETLCAGLDSIPFGNALDVLLARLRAEVGEDLGDDLALVMAEYDPPAR
jgi:serine phosphatase RsbU (regulator of sigma subunit)